MGSDGHVGVGGVRFSFDLSEIGKKVKVAIEKKSSFINPHSIKRFLTHVGLDPLPPARAPSSSLQEFFDFWMRGTGVAMTVISSILQALYSYGPTQKDLL